MMRLIARWVAQEDAVVEPPNQVQWDDNAPAPGKRWQVELRREWATAQMKWPMRGK